MPELVGYEPACPASLQTPVVHWLMIPAERVPEGDEWLSASEREAQAGLRFPPRRRDWRLGRWVAKSALRRRPGSPLAGLPPETLSILPDEDGAPTVRCFATPVDSALSLSHRGGWGLAVVGPAGLRLGCDLEIVEPRSAAFVEDYLTAGERRLVASAGPEQRDLLANLVWSAKESAVKAQRSGLRVDTRSVEVELRPWDESREWRPLEVRSGRSRLAGWWRRDGERLATVVGTPAPAIPVPLISLRRRRPETAAQARSA